jgi:hypothetical protein
MEFGVLFHDRRLQVMECFVSKSRGSPNGAGAMNIGKYKTCKFVSNCLNRS